jgi:hypothetical protein
MYFEINLSVLMNIFFQINVPQFHVLLSHEVLLFEQFFVIKMIRSFM